MTDFEYDCLQKKRLAGQAKYRKCGRKSKKCSLPSDGMTQKQWKERCGPVVSFSLNKPMDWGTFKKLSPIVQKEYITNLQKNYGATAVDLGEMFGVQSLTVRKYVDANGLGITFPRGHAMSAGRRAVWNEFLYGNSSDEPETVSPDPVDSADVDTETARAESDNVTEATDGNDMRLRKFSMQFSGEIDVAEIANSLKWILGGNTNGELEIICTLS